MEKRLVVGANEKHSEGEEGARTKFKGLPWAVSRKKGRVKGIAR